MKNRITIICFLIMIFGLSIFSLIKKDKHFSENENRVLSGKPEFEMQAILNGEYEEKYEDYISDQFILRDWWIGIKTCCDLAMLKKEVNGVYFCQDDYLISAHNQEEYNSDTAWENYKCVKNFINKYKENINVKLMIVPTSQEVLKDKLPPYVDAAGEIQLINTIYNDMDSANVVNVSDTLCTHSNEYIFYRTDHHWTTLGAYYAYTEYMNSIGEIADDKERYNIEKVTDKFYGTNSSKVNIRTLSDDIYLYKLKENIDISIRYNETEDIRDTLYYEKALDTKDKYSVFLGGNNSFLEIKTYAENEIDVTDEGYEENKINEVNGGRLLVIKDSYAHSFIPFLIDRFSEIDIVDLRYYNKSIEALIEERNYTHLLILYNIDNLATDNNLYKLNLPSQ